MRNALLLLLSVLVAASCKNKTLCDDGVCVGDTTIKVVVNWDDSADARAMRMNIFSRTPDAADYGRDNIPGGGEKNIMLVEGASYLPYCYDYYASNIYFRNETMLESFQAYCIETSRTTYSTRATPVEGEATVTDPGGDFYVHSWQETFDVIFCGECGDNVLILNFYPKNILRQFTYRINGIKGAQNIKEARGAISGMAAAYFFYTDKLTTERSTVLFENATFGTDTDGNGYIEGSFTTFGPVYPYANRFTIEVLSGTNYYTYYWDMSGQIGESMADRDAKIARDGYDILIQNNDEIPEIPDPGGDGGSGGGSGFEIGVGEWSDVEIYL